MCARLARAKAKLGKKEEWADQATDGFCGDPWVLCRASLTMTSFHFRFRQLRCAVAIIRIKAMFVNKNLWRRAAHGAILSLVVAACPELHPSQVVLRSDLVLVPVTVQNKRGEAVTDLRQEEFKLYDNGQERSIAFFSFETETDQLSRPLALVLLLDASRSISAILHQQRSAVTSLLESLGKQTRVSLIGFSDRPEVLLDFTGDKTDALNAFVRHRRIGGNTAIFDSLVFALGHLGRAASDSGVRKIIVLISDGLDTASQESFQTCVRQAQEQGMAIYSILIPIYSPYGDRLVARRPSRGFIEVAQESGGKFFQAGTMEQALNPGATLDLGPIFQSIVKDLRHQYYLGFYPAENNEPGFHRVAVQVGRKNLKVQLRRKGYFAR
jgi:Ca-activated chloride channel family protein